MVEEKMNKDKALQIVASAATQYRGTAQEHKLIQEAIQFIVKELNDKSKSVQTIPDKEISLDKKIIKELKKG